jgi:hypothetical protein
MTQWYQSHVDRRNTSLIRRVIFSRLFYNQNYSYSTLFKTSILQLIVAHLIFPSTYIIQMVNNGSCNSTMVTTTTSRTHPLWCRCKTIDRPSSTSLDRTTSHGADARHQSTDAIYESKTLIKKEKE